MSNSFFMPFKTLILLVIFFILFISIFFIPVLPESAYSFSSYLDQNLVIDISSLGYAWPSPRIHNY